MSRYGNIDYRRFAKGGFLLGLVLFGIGAGGELLGHLLFQSLPAWEATLLFDLEVVGILIGFFSPLVFGVVLPLTE